jgi:hypothetical protein
MSEVDEPPIASSQAQNDGSFTIEKDMRNKVLQQASQKNVEKDLIHEESKESEAQNVSMDKRRDSNDVESC